MPLIKRSFTLNGHRTSLALEAEFWQVVDEVAGLKDVSVSGLIAEIDAERDPDDSLSSVMRVWALTQLRQRLSDQTAS
ncbi:ribbon-helix-helix domain-containing protein [Roseibium sediminis]|uniref:ribbon-helix-helix domain-containing protein n=1 Tax=Roseibium sediminis TaxID=1775174 RepID=UPI00123CFBC8|nr:ribbon-helix-helix domain-containing protein [Roseibium sediminis]